MASSVRFDTSAKSLHQLKQQALGNAHKETGLPPSQHSSGAGLSEPQRAPSYQSASTQLLTKQFRSSPVKHTPSASVNLNAPASKDFRQSPAKPQRCEQNALASHLFQSSDDGDDFQATTSDNYALGEEDGGDPTCGDSDFEPAEQSARGVVPYLQHKGAGNVSSYFELERNNLLMSQYEFEQQPESLLHSASSANYQDAIDYKLAGEHELGFNGGGFKRPADNSDTVYRLRGAHGLPESSKPNVQPTLKNQNNFDVSKQISSHLLYDTTKHAENSSISNESNSAHTTSNQQNINKSVAAPKQQYKQTDEQQHYLLRDHSDEDDDDIDEDMMDDDMGRATPKAPTQTYKTAQLDTQGSAKTSTNVRRFARNTGTYQSSFGKHVPSSQLSQGGDEHSADSEAEQFQFSGGAKQQTRYQQRHDSSYSSEEEHDILLNPDFKSHYYLQADVQQPRESIEMKELKRKTWDQPDQKPASTIESRAQIQKQAAMNLQQIKANKDNRWVQEQEQADLDDSKFKSTAVGFSPAQQQQVNGFDQWTTTQNAQAKNQGSTDQKNSQPTVGEQPTKSLTSFGWRQEAELSSQKKKSPTAQGKPNTVASSQFETMAQVREREQFRAAEQNMSHFEQASQFGQYAMLYPPKQISKETWDTQHKNMQGSSQQPAPATVSQKEKRKKKKEVAPEAHFLLTGSLATHLESRSFFRNTDDKSQKKPTQQETSAPSQSACGKEALMEWFESLSLQDRVNSLTTTYPLFVASIIEAQQKHVRQNGPLCLFTIKKEKQIEASSADAAAVRRRQGQNSQAQEDLTILERVMSQDDQFRGHNNFYSDQTSVRSFQTRIIKYMRLTSNKNVMDTLTVCPQLVRDSQEFFSLIENLTDGKAFTQPITYVTKHGSGGKPLIQSPRWIDSKKQNYLGVWIVAILEETLWAHFNYAKQVNFSSGVRKNELNQLFELRSENLQNQEDLAKRWTELSEKGQQKLITQLSSTAKDEPPSKFQTMYDEQERRNPSQYSHHQAQTQPYHEDIFTFCNQPRFGLYQFTEVPLRQNISDIQDSCAYYAPRDSQTQGFLEQQGLASLPQSGKQNSMMYMHNDKDLKEIIDVMSYVGALDFIKFLSEIPMQEVNQRNYIRKHYLCRQLHLMIQADLRQSIQDQLMNELLAIDNNNSKDDKNQLKDQNSTGGKKKKPDNRKNRKGGGNSNQNQNNGKKEVQAQYQKKKQSISKSPIRQQTEVIQAVQQTSTSLQSQKNESSQQQTAAKNSQAKQQQLKSEVKSSRVASTTTSDDQHSSTQNEVVITQPPQQQQQQKKQQAQTQSGKKRSKAGKGSQEQQQKPTAPAVVQGDAVLKHVRALLGDLVESVCVLEAERQETELQQLQMQSELEKQQEALKANVEPVPAKAPSTPHEQQQPLYQSDSDKSIQPETPTVVVQSPPQTPQHQPQAQEPSTVATLQQPATKEKQQPNQQQQQSQEPSSAPSSKKPRRRKAQKKQDAEELVNNFMRKINGADNDDAESQPNSKQNAGRNNQKNDGGRRQAQQTQDKQQAKQQQDSNHRGQAQDKKTKNDASKQATKVQQQSQPKKGSEVKGAQNQQTKPKKADKNGEVPLETTVVEEPQPIAVVSPSTIKEKVLPEPAAEKLLAKTQSPQASKMKKSESNKSLMAETQTLVVFSFENQPNLQASALKAPEFKANDSVISLVSPFTATTTDETTVHKTAAEPQVSSQIQTELETSPVEISIPAELPIAPQASGTAQPVKISLTEHFTQPALNLNAFKTMDDIFGGADKPSHLYENQQIQFIDYSAPQAQPASKVLEQDPSPVNATPFVWQQPTVNLPSSTEATAEQPVLPAKGVMSTTSVSFTPTLQLQPQMQSQPVDSTSPALDDSTAKPQLAQDFVLPSSAQQSPTLDKYNSTAPPHQVFFEQQASLNFTQPNKFQPQQPVAVSSFPPPPSSTQTQDKMVGFTQQPAFQASTTSPQTYPQSSQHMPKSGIYKKQSAPFRSQTQQQVYQPTFQPGGFSKSPTSQQSTEQQFLNYQQPDLGSQGSSGSSSYHSNHQQRGSKNNMGAYPKKFSPDHGETSFQQQQPAAQQQFYQPFSGSPSQAETTTTPQVKTPQIRLDAPSFEPVIQRSQTEATSQAQQQPQLNNQASDFRKQQPLNWNQLNFGTPQQTQQQPLQTTAQQSQQTYQAPQLHKSQSEQVPAHHSQQSYAAQSQYLASDSAVQTNQHPLFLQLEDQFYRNFDKDIEKTTTKIQATIERYEDERMYVLQKLQTMANAAFPGRTPTIKVFGSLMTGLALETSDMDIAVTGLRIDGREDMIDDLQALADQVQKWPLIKDFKAIETASIPVIKAQLEFKDIMKEMGKKGEDTDAVLPIDITFDDSPAELPQPQMPPLQHSQSQPVYGQEYGQQQHGQMMGGMTPMGGAPHSKMPADPMTQLQNLISGELGFNIQDQLIGYGMDFGGPPPPKTHLGLASCRLLKNYVRDYPYLKEVAVLLKHFLAVNNLNQSYLGGISSYSAVLLIVAYMNNFKLHLSPHLTPSRLLMGFLDFYSNCFDPRHFGVNTSKGMSFYQLPQVNQHMFLIVDPVNPTNNTARNSFRTADVLAHFRAAFFSLKSQITKQFQKQMAQAEAERALKSELDAGTGRQDSEKAAGVSVPAGQQAKVEKPPSADGNGRARAAPHSGKKSNVQASQDPTGAKASEQQQPSSNAAGPNSATAQGFLFPAKAAGASAQTLAAQQPGALAFDSVNFVDCFLSPEILREGGTDKQANVVEALSGFRGALAF